MSEFLIDNGKLVKYAGAGGEIVVPDEPGLGIHITDEIIEKYAYIPGTEQRFKVETK